MLRVFPEIQQTGIDFIDIGCRGELDERWRPVAPLLNYVGFDPDGAEVSRLEREPNPYRQRRYFPYAVGGTEGRATLHCTESPYCWSLLQPRHVWMQRLNCYNSFRETGETSVPVTTLDALAQRESLRADVLKIDTQGLELPILSHAQHLLADTLCVEAETGFVENYVGETVAAQVDEMLRARGFLMFDITVHRVGRNNPLAAWSVKQPFYCETLWLRVFLSDTSWRIPVEVPPRATAVKALVICWVLGVADYGVELAEHCRAKGVLTAQELAHLRQSRVWETRPTKDGAVTKFLRLLPGSVRRRLSAGANRFAAAADAARQRPHLLRSSGRRNR